MVVTIMHTYGMDTCCVSLSEVMRVVYRMSMRVGVGLFLGDEGGGMA